MSPVLKLCGLLAVFALVVLANPTKNKKFDEAKLSQSKDEILQSSSGYVNDEPGSPAENTTPEVLVGKDDETTTEDKGAAPTPEPTLTLASPSSPSSASPPTGVVTEQTSSSTKGVKGTKDETTPTIDVSTTTVPTTTPVSSSSLASPNKILSFAALMFMLIVKMFGAY